MPLTIARTLSTGGFFGVSCGATVDLAAGRGVRIRRRRLLFPAPGPVNHKQNKKQPGRHRETADRPSSNVLHHGAPIEGWLNGLPRAIFGRVRGPIQAERKGLYTDWRQFCSHYSSRENPRQTIPVRSIPAGGIRTPSSGAQTGSIPSTAATRNLMISLLWGIVAVESVGSQAATSAPAKAQCQRSSTVELWFCKPGVVGSNPTVGCPPVGHPIPALPERCEVLLLLPRGTLAVIGR